MAERFGAIYRDIRVYTASEINALIEELRDQIGGDGSFHYRGERQACDELPLPDPSDSSETGPRVGDVYQVLSECGDTPAGAYWFWNGEEWRPLSSSGGGQPSILGDVLIKNEDSHFYHKLVAKTTADGRVVLALGQTPRIGTSKDVYVVDENNLYHKLVAKTVSGRVVLALVQEGVYGPDTP